MTDRERRVASVVGAVVEASLRAAGSTALYLLDDGSPESALCARWLGGRAGIDLRTVAAAPVEPGLQPVQALESARALARSRAAAEGGLVAGPANRTALMLAPRSWPDDLLPLGDLAASRVAALAGAWSGPPEAEELAARLGGVEQLDAALEAWLAGRPPDGPSDAVVELRALLDRGRFARRWPRVVPKLENRTAWVDLGR